MKALKTKKGLSLSDISGMFLRPQDINGLYLGIGGGSLSGKLIAQNNTDYAVAQVRNVIFGTSETPPETWQPGDIYIQYEE